MMILNQILKLIKNMIYQVIGHLLLTMHLDQIMLSLKPRAPSNGILRKKINQDLTKIGGNQLKHISNHFKIVHLTN